jgi:DNA invertase Pin-like site-specific DNA recombinase
MKRRKSVMSDSKKVAVYCRVDSKNIMGIRQQVAVIRNYAKEYRCGNLEFYIDNGISGIGLDRPMLNRLNIDIANGLVKAVVVTEISRISRNHFDMLAWVGSIRRRGISFIAVIDGIYCDSSENNADLFMRYCKLFERQEIRQR